MELFELGVSFPVSDQELEQQMARLWGSGEPELLTPAVLTLLGQAALRCGRGTAGGGGQGRPQAWPRQEGASQPLAWSLWCWPWGKNVVADLKWWNVTSKAFPFFAPSYFNRAWIDGLLLLLFKAQMQLILFF